MLVLSRKVGEVLEVGPDIRIRVVRISADSVRIGIEAPLEIVVRRVKAVDRDHRASQSVMIPLIQEDAAGGQEGHEAADETADTGSDSGGNSGTVCGHTIATARVNLTAGRGD